MRWKMTEGWKDRCIGSKSCSDREWKQMGRGKRWRERESEKRTMRRRWQSALFKLTKIFTKPRVMWFPLKALFSWAGRQPLVMHKCICDAHTWFKIGQILEKGWTRTFHCQGVFSYEIVSGCVLPQDPHGDHRLNLLCRIHLFFRRCNMKIALIKKKKSY